MKFGRLLADLPIYLLAVVLAVGYEYFLASSFDLIPGPGGFFGNDGYIRMLRIENLLATGDWYNNVIDRSNAPYGMEMHWTRPFDILLLAGAAILSPILGFEAGLYFWSIWIGPFLFVLIVCAFVWATVPIFQDLLRRICLLLAIFFQPAFAALSRPGKPDHHNLIVLVSIVAIGLMLRLLAEERPKGTAVCLGGILAFGIWLSPEFLVITGPVLAFLALLWVLQGELYARYGLDVAIGLAAIVALGLAAELPPQRWFELMYDRISIVHLLMAALSLVFWMAVIYLSSHSGLCKTMTRRALVALSGGAITLGLMYGLAADFFSLPQFYSHPLVGEAYIERISELQSIWPRDWESLGRFALYLGPVLLVIPTLLYLLIWAEPTHSKRWNIWLFLALCLAIYVPFGAHSLRYVVYPTIIIVIGLAEFLGRSVEALDRIPGLLFRTGARALLVLACLMGFILMRTGETQTATAENRSDGAKTSCQLNRAFEVLNNHPAFARQSHIVIAHPDYGPRMLYRTKHEIVGSPYHRNESGILDSLLTILATSDAEAKEIVAKRGVGAILVCELDIALHGSMSDAPIFFERLWDGVGPSWLEEVEIDTGQPLDFKIFKVIPANLGSDPEPS